MNGLFQTLHLARYLGYAVKYQYQLFVLFVVLACGSWLYLGQVSQTGKPTYFEPQGPLNLEVALGEIITKVVIFNSSRDNGPVKIHISRELRPFLFLSNSPLVSESVKAGGTYPIQLTVTAAPDATPGVYKGTLSLEGHESLQIVLTVREPCKGNDCDSQPINPNLRQAFADGRGVKNVDDKLPKPNPDMEDVNEEEVSDTDGDPMAPDQMESDSITVASNIGPGALGPARPDADAPDQTDVPVIGMGDDTVPVPVDSQLPELQPPPVKQPEEPPSPESPPVLLPPDPLAVEHANRTPTRLVQGPNGNFYVSDASANAVFVYNPDLKLIGEYKGSSRPLGVAVDEAGNVYIGNGENDTVDLYDKTGEFVRTVVAGVQMPTDLALDGEGRLYTVDSLSDSVKVHDANGVWLHDLGGPGDGPGQMRFPIAVAVSNSAAEVYVADQGHGLVHVYDMDGVFLRSFGGPTEAFSSNLQGKFAKLQSLAVDAQGRLHALDSYNNRTQVFDPVTGDYLSTYGSYGTGAGKLNVPLDLWINTAGKVAVTNYGNRRVEYIYTIPGP